MIVILILYQYQMNSNLEKYFIYFVGYINPSDDRIYSSLIKLAKLNRSAKSFEKVKYKFFMFNEKH